jgi:hypothetical protein
MTGKCPTNAFRLGGISSSLPHPSIEAEIWLIVVSIDETMVACQFLGELRAM